LKLLTDIDRMKRLFIVALAIVTMAAHSNAGVNHWTSRGPTKPGAISALLVNPFNPNVVYYTSDAGLFRSLDAGDSWQAINAGLSETHISAATVRHDSPGTLYAGTRSGAIFRTRDGGELWTEVARVDDIVNVLTFDSVRGDLYARIGNRIRRSPDEGETWQDVAAPLPGGWWWGDIAAMRGKVFLLVDVTFTSAMMKALPGLCCAARWTHSQSTRRAAQLS